MLLVLVLVLFLLLSLFFSSKNSVAEHAAASDSLLFSSLRSSRNTRYFSRFAYTNPKQKRTISGNSCDDNTIGDSSRARELGASGGALGRTRVFIFTAAATFT
jgi:hypothetical protein